MFVPVVNFKNEPLMPTTPSQARRFVRSRMATPFWKKGVFCIRMNVLTKEYKQNICVGIDPGSKKEGYTVKSTAHTYLNIQANAVTWVKDAIETRRNMRKNRRYRKTPCRQNRLNNKRKDLFLPPSTKARWQWKLRILNWLKKIFPVSCVIVEDIKAVTKGKRKWDNVFSPLQIGKQWFYNQIENLYLKFGYETKDLRNNLGLKKSKDKMSKSFDAHCVDSWVLANSIVGGHIEPDNKDILHIVPLRFYRRQLHVLKPSKGGLRKSYGGTISMGLKRGSLVKHIKYGVCYVGGTSKDRISLHDLSSGERLAQNCKVEHCEFLCYTNWRTQR